MGPGTWFVQADEHKSQTKDDNGEPRLTNPGIAVGRFYARFEAVEVDQRGLRGLFREVCLLTRD